MMASAGRRGPALSRRRSNIKRLEWIGPAALVALAFAVGAPSAVAAVGFAAEEYPVTFSGTQQGTPTFEFESGGELAVECSKATFTATVSESSGAAESLKVTPSYSECASGEIATTVTTTGCTYVLHGGEETAEDEFSGKVDVSCEAGKAILIASAFCELKIEGQTGLSSVSYVDNTGESPINFTATTSLSKMKFTVTKGGGSCPLVAATKETGTLSQVELVKGTAAEEGVGVWVDDRAVLCAAKEPDCAAGNIYATNTFLQAAATSVLLKAGALEITCSAAEITGKNSAALGDPILPLSIETLGFTPCVEKGTANACTINPTAVPLVGRVGPLGNLGDGFLSLISTTQLRVICNAKPFNCDYGGRIGFDVKGGAPGSLEIPAAKPEKMKHVVRGGEQNCVASLEWSGTYSITKPKSLYVTNVK